MLVKYLSKKRIYTYEGIRLEIAPEVFHPGFFFRTKLLFQYIKKIPLQGKIFLELGCGSGLISIMAAKQGAVVTATDINPIAIDFLKGNSMRNNVKIELIRSDLFKNISSQKFDIIAINPPYYKKDPATAKDHAWYCGENGEYFSSLFNTLADHIHPGTKILMVLSDGCDMGMINGFAAKKGFAFNCVHSKNYMMEKNFIFKIEKN